MFGKHRPFLSSLFSSVLTRTNKSVFWVVNDKRERDRELKKKRACTSREKKREVGGSKKRRNRRIELKWVVVLSSYCHWPSVAIILYGSTMLWAAVATVTVISCPSHMTVTTTSISITVSLSCNHGEGPEWCSQALFIFSTLTGACCQWLPWQQISE